MKYKKKIWTILETLLIYFLSVKYICFAIPKLFEMQFTTLRYKAYTPLAELSKHDHMWSFFGRSYNYNLFIAITEIIIGMLLVFKRTRLIALLLLFGVSLNILILNIEFDNDFALYHTTFDFIACLALLITYLPDLKRFFIDNAGRIKHSNFSQKSTFKKLFPVAFISIVFIGYTIFAYSLKRQYKNELEGSYIIQKMELNGIESNISKGKQGEQPMLFIEYNRMVALSLNDSLTFGSITKVNGEWKAKFNLPHTKNFAVVTINKNELKGLLYSFSENTPLDTIRMNIQRINENKNYLNKR